MTCTLLQMCYHLLSFSKLFLKFAIKLTDWIEPVTSRQVTFPGRLFQKFVIRAEILNGPWTSRPTAHQRNLRVGLYSWSQFVHTRRVSRFLCWLPPCPLSWSSGHQCNEQRASRHMGKLLQTLHPKEGYVLLYLTLKMYHELGMKKNQLFFSSAKVTGRPLCRFQHPPTKKCGK